MRIQENYKSTSNLIRLTVISYFLTCVTGVSVILPFVIKQSVSNYFHSDIAYIGFVFSFFMIGMLASEFLNGFIVKILSLKQELYLISIIYLLCVISIFIIIDVKLLIPVLFVMGFCFGMTITMPNFIIVHAFTGVIRSTKLNRLDFFFSVGSSGYPLIAGWLIVNKFSWQSVYLLIIIFFIIIVFMCFITKFPDMNIADKEAENKVKFSRWNLSVYFVGFSILLYFMSYIGFTYWITDYLIDFLSLSEQAANWGVALFWILYAVGCYLSSLAVKRIPVNKYIIISTIVAVFSYFAIYFSSNVFMMLIFISILGLGCATVYSSSISYGTLLVEHPSPRIVSFFIFTSGVGTWLGEVYSSFMVSAFGVPSIIFVSAAMMLIVSVIMIIISMVNKNIDVNRESLH